MSTRAKKSRRGSNQKALPEQCSENTPKIEELAKLQTSLEELVPKEVSKESLLAVRFLVQHRHEFPALDQMMAESLQNEGKRRQSLVDTVTSNMTSIVKGYNFREFLKIAIVGIYALAASGGGLWLMISEKQFALGAGLLASPFIGGILKSMFRRLK